MKKEIIGQLSILITSAFGFVAALAWNEAVQAIFKRLFGATEGLLPMIIYALIVTVVAVVVTIWIGRVADKLDK
ncbi:MAG: DUF5654 family protein [Candidatus Staskawiczbacteria bacterium]|jgi:hypothetical protein